MKIQTIKIKLLKIREDGTATGRFWGDSFNRSFNLNVNILGETVVTLRDRTLGNKNEYILSRDPKAGEWEEYSYYPEDIIADENIIEDNINDNQMSLF